MKNLLIALVVLGLAAAASATLIYSESFTYADGSVTNGSAGVWTRHSGTADDALVSGNALEVFAARADDVNRALGTTYSSGNLYVAMDINLATQPSAGGTYFASLYQNSTTFRDRIFVNSSGATGGGYFVGVGNGTSGQVMWTTELSLSTVYTVVIRSDLDNDISYLWVNPASEGSPSINTNIASTTTASAFAFRQAAGEGNITVDNLNIGTTFNDVVIPEPGTIALISIGLGLFLVRRFRRA